MNLLKETRLKCGKTQEQVAKEIGVSYSLYQKLEQGDRRLSGLAILTGLRLEESLNCNIRQLLEAEGTISSTSPY